MTVRHRIWRRLHWWVNRVAWWSGWPADRPYRLHTHLLWVLNDWLASKYVSQMMADDLQAAKEREAHEEDCRP